MAHRQTKLILLRKRAVSNIYAR